MTDFKINFFKKIEQLNEEEYAEKFIGYLISPVITGIKPSSTITLNDTRRKIYSYWIENGHSILSQYNLEAITLKESQDSIILLVYDRYNLDEHLRLEKNKNFLCSYGYGDPIILEKCLNCLKNRVNGAAFPHESGIFLGIPSEDVVGFLNEEECLFEGYWKVYSNNYKVKEIFYLYEKSREIYIFNTLRNKEKVIKNLFRDQKNLLYMPTN